MIKFMLVSLVGMSAVGIAGLFACLVKFIWTYLF